MICSGSNRSTSSLKSKRSDVRDCEVSVRPRPEKAGGAPFEDRAFEPPRVLGACEVPPGALEETDRGPRFPEKVAVKRAHSFKKKLWQNELVSLLVQLLATAEDGERDWAEGGEKDIVLLERALVTEAVLLGAAVLPFFVDEGVEAALERLAAASHSAEPTGASWC